MYTARNYNQEPSSHERPEDALTQLLRGASITYPGEPDMLTADTVTSSLSASPHLQLVALLRDLLYGYGSHVSKDTWNLFCGEATAWVSERRGAYGYWHAEWIYPPRACRQFNAVLSLSNDFVRIVDIYARIDHGLLADDPAIMRRGQ